MFWRVPRSGAGRTGTGFRLLPEKRGDAVGKLPVVWMAPLTEFGDLIAGSIHARCGAPASEAGAGWNRATPRAELRDAIMASMRPTLLSLIWLLIGSSTLGWSAPNIVVLFADDLGYGDLGSYGNPTIRTPNLDRLAAEGLRMTSFYSAPSCVPARTQLLLGRYPSRTAIRRTSVGGDGGIPSDLTTLAEGLRSVGYRTAMAGKWHLGYAREEYLPVGKGFDQWFGLPYSNDMIKPWVQTDEPLWLYRNAEKVEHPVDQDHLTIRYTDEVVKFIRETSGEPFFVYLAYSMPHLPLRTAGRFRGTSRAGLYGGRD